MEPIYGMYRLVFSNGKFYIGIARDVQKRFRDHKSEASKGSTLPVHCAIRKHGAPTLERLAIGRRSYICELEIAAIAAFQTRDRRFGYNLALGGETSPMHDARVAAKVSASKLGKKVPRISAALSGRVMSEQARAINAAAHRGLKASPETRAKMSAAKVGRIFSPEVRANMSAAKRAWDAAHPEARKGRTCSPETREKLRAAASDRIWMTDGLRSFRIHRRVPLPHGWSYGVAPGAAA